MAEIPTPFVNLARTVVTTPPSPATTGTTLVIPKITLPELGVIGGSTSPLRATVAPVGEAANQSNAEILAITAIVEEADKEHLKLTIVRKAEGSNARAIQAGDVFDASITAASLNPGPWENPKMINEVHVFSFQNAGNEGSGAGGPSSLKVRLEQNGTVVAFKGQMETTPGEPNGLLHGESMFELTNPLMIPADSSRNIRLFSTYNIAAGLHGSAEHPGAYGTIPYQMTKLGTQGGLFTLKFIRPAYATGSEVKPETMLIPPGADLPLDQVNYRI